MAYRENSQWSLALFIVIFSVHLLETRAQTVTSLSRSRSIISGGLTMTVSGSGFSSGSSPRAVISVYYQNSLDQRFTGDVCTVTSSSSMSCILPEISQFPTGFTPPDITLGANPLLNDGDISFRVGVTFTGVQTHREYQDLNMYADPDLSGNDISRSFTIWTRQDIVVIGQQLTAAGLTTNDYRVVLNDQECDMQFVNNTYLSCLLPLDIPTADNGQFTNIYVEVGGVRQLVGEIWYRVPQIDIANPLPVITYNPNDFSSRIEVTGTGLIVGLTSENYNVRLGQSPCLDVVVTTTTLSCRGQPTSPRPSGLYPQHPDNYPQLIIKVPESNTAAFSYTYHPAYVRYLNHDYSQDSAVPDGEDNTNFDNNNNNNDNNDDNNDDGNDGGDDSNDDAVKWVIISIAIVAALAFLALLAFCLCCSRRSMYVREEKKEGRYLDTVAVIPPPGRSDPSTSGRTRSHHSQPSRVSSAYPTPSDLYRMYGSRYPS